jgi:hypothetical protein
LNFCPFGRIKTKNGGIFMSAWSEVVLFGEILAVPLLAATFTFAARSVSRQVKSPKPVPKRIEPRLS